MLFVNHFFVWFFSKSFPEKMLFFLKNLFDFKAFVKLTNAEAIPDDFLA